MVLLQLVPLLALVGIGVAIFFTARRKQSVPATGVPVGEPSGIGGWLILPAIALVVSPVFSVLTIVQALALMEDAAFVPGLQTAILIEVAGEALLGIGFLFVAVRFFQRKQNTPRMFILLVVANLVFIVLDAIAIGVAFSIPVFDAQGAATVVRAVIYAAIWIPYMLRSVRVRNTFVVP